MVLLIGLLLMLGLAFGPSLWVKHVLARYSEPRTDFPGTGGELARHLLDEMKLDHVTVEVTKAGDHYDPEAKAVRLSPDHHDGRSLAAVAVAAHEVGHAMQDATGYAMLKRRTSMAKMTHLLEKIGGVVMLGAPLLAVLTRSPAGFVAEFAAGLVILGMSVVIHLITLPVELDASFNRALKVLETGRYLPEDDMPAVRKILWAAALTYVAAAMMSLLNVARWLRVLRF
ncbi:MAG: zinc metallopeptidase [Hyphomicrobiales bacterium]